MIARALAGLALAALAAGAGSCALALGVQDDPHVVSADICGCPAFMAHPADCQAGLESRLAGASPSDRSTWLQGYAARCAGSCSAALTCYYQAPACAAQGAPCTFDEECCSFAQTPKLATCSPIHGTCQ